MNKTEGLVAATHTPMSPDGSVNLDIVPDYFKFLKRNGIRGIFLNGSTSEGYHLTTDERKHTVEAWTSASRGSKSKLFVFIYQQNGWLTRIYEPYSSSQWIIA